VEPLLNQPHASISRGIVSDAGNEGADQSHADSDDSSGNHEYPVGSGSEDPPSDEEADE
jgi:hypothetical protein